jgi:apolipoprotein N-acyltransferase
LTEEGKAEVRQRLNQAVDTALQQNPDFLILPEGANYLQHEKPLNQAVRQFQQNYPETKTILIDSGSAAYGKDTVVEAVVVDPLREKGEVVHKRYLVPQGEFMPTVYTIALRFLGSESMVSYVKSKIALTVGPQTNQSVLDDRAPGILLCFESMSPLGVRTILNEKPIVPFIAHPISHQWFHEPVIWWHDVDVVLRVQALWNRVYIVSAGNHVAGKTYAPNGSIVSMDTVAVGDDWEIKQVQLPR